LLQIGNLEEKCY